MGEGLGREVGVGGREGEVQDLSLVEGLVGDGGQKRGGIDLADRDGEGLADRGDAIGDSDGDSIGAGTLGFVAAVAVVTTIGTYAVFERVLTVLLPRGAWTGF